MMAVDVTMFRCMKVENLCQGPRVYFLIGRVTICVANVEKIEIGYSIS